MPFFFSSHTINLRLCATMLFLSPLLNETSFAESKVLSTNIFFDASVGIDLEYVQNANRSILSEDEIDELQTHTELAVSGAYYGDLISRAQIDYDIYDDQFAQDSQESESGINGEASVFIGRNLDFYEFGLTHSSQRQFIDPEGADITDNLTDRNIFTALAALKSRTDKVNYARLEFTTTKVTFDDSEINDSTRDSLDLNLTRKLNTLTNVGVTFSISEIDYDINDISDYDLQRVSVFFSRNLRRIDYSLDIGLYEVEDNLGNTTDEPYINAALNYGDSNFSFFSNIERDVTDSSIGDGNSNINDTPDIDGQLNLQDQITREYIAFGINTGIICSACQLNLEWNRESQDYLNLFTENSEVDSLSLHLQREVKSNMTAELRIRVLDFTYTNRDDLSDYKETTIRASLGFKSFGKRLFGSIYAGLQERKFDQGSSYRSPSLGLGVSYLLY